MKTLTISDAALAAKSLSLAAQYYKLPISSQDLALLFSFIQHPIGTLKLGETFLLHAIDSDTCRLQVSPVSLNGNGTGAACVEMLANLINISEAIGTFFADYHCSANGSIVPLALNILTGELNGIDVAGHHQINKIYPTRAASGFFNIRTRKQYTLYPYPFVSVCSNLSGKLPFLTDEVNTRISQRLQFGCEMGI